MPENLRTTLIYALGTAIGIEDDPEVKQDLVEAETYLTHFKEVGLYDSTRQIADVWDISDVQIMDDKLTDEQAMKVLEFCDRTHDAGIGINWEVVEQAITTLERTGELS